jgi:flagella basal body P-ring formation protein FlgA
MCLSAPVELRQNTQMTTFRLFASILGIALSSLAITTAAAPQDSINTVVTQFLHKETQGLPGRVSFSIGALDPRTQLTPCPALEAFHPAGGRLWGKTTVGVRCQMPNGWTVYVPVQISVTAPYLVTARPLSQGQSIAQSDLLTQNGDLAALPSGILSEPSQAIGKTLRNSVGVGQPIRSDMLLAPLIIKQGQAVKLIAGGAGFSVTGDGIALGNASEGQTIQIRTPNGATVSGVARQGNVVEIGNF